MNMTEIMTDNSDPGEELLAKLKAFPSGKIYMSAPRNEVLEGMTLLRGGPVRDFSWSNDRTVLNLELADSQLHEVSFSIAAGALNHSCDCGLLNGCRHLVCALATR